MSEPRDTKLLVITLGGSAWREARGRGKPEEPIAVLGRTLAPLVELVGAGFRLVLTHGSPRQEPRRAAPASRVPPGHALDVGTAELQGTLGYAIQQAFGNLCRGRGLDVPVAAVVTRVLVDPRDPAFARPTTPIGPAYPPTRVKRLARATGWTIGRDGRRGFRRLVASPRPVRVLDAEVVRRLSLAGAITIACGGGGVPVAEAPDGFRGVEAVIEPELGAAALATGVGAGRLVMLTAVEHAAVSYGTPREIRIERLTLAEGRTLLAAGEFPPRSMGPKVEAGLRFVEAGGGEAIITSLARVSAALAGEAGTRIVAAN